MVTTSGTGVGQPTLYSYATRDGSAPGGWLPNEVLTTTDGLSLTDGTLRQAFGYDGVGDTTVITTGAYNGQPQAVRRLAYNAQGLLSTVTTTVAGAPVIVESIGYDALGRRGVVAVTDSAPPVKSRTKVRRRVAAKVHEGIVGQSAQGRRPQTSA